MHAIRIWTLLALPFLATRAAAEDWPNFRGPNAGLSASKNLPLTWNARTGENVRWKSLLVATVDKVKLDGNQSSPIVSGGQVFVTFSYWPSSSTTKEQPEHHVVAFDAASGKRQWDVKIEPGPWTLRDLRGGYTAPTPAADGERIYVLFGSSVLAALDRQGNLVWRRTFEPHAFDVALAASPVLYKDLVLVMCEMTSDSRILAFNKANGEVRYVRDRKDANWTHSTPVVAKVAGKDQLLVSGAHALEGLDPATGATIWHAADKTQSRVGDAPSPAFGAGVVYCDSGRGGAGLAVDPTGSGDVSKTHVKWISSNIADGLGSPVIVGDYLYRLQGPGILKCIKLPEGKLEYAERLNDAVTASSPIATADGRIYVVNAGVSYVVRAGPEFEILGTGTLGESSQSSPAIANDRIYVRGQKHLYCIGK